MQWREKGHNLGLTRSLLESLAVLYVCSYWCCHLLHPGSLLFPAYNLLWTAWTLSALAKTLVGLDTCVEFVGSMHVDFLWRLTNYRTTKTSRHGAPWPCASCQIHTTNWSHNWSTTTTDFWCFTVEQNCSFVSPCWHLWETTYLQ